MYQMNTWYTVNLQNVVCQLCLDFLKNLSFGGGHEICVDVKGQPQEFFSSTVFYRSFLSGKKKTLYHLLLLSYSFLYLKTTTLQAFGFPPPFVFSQMESLYCALSYIKEAADSKSCLHHPGK